MEKPESKPAWYVVSPDIMEQLQRDYEITDMFHFRIGGSIDLETLKKTDMCYAWVSGYKDALQHVISVILEAGHKLTSDPLTKENADAVEHDHS